MPDLTPEIAEEVVAASKAGAEEAAGALSRALDAEITLEVGEAGKWGDEAADAGLEGPGLAGLDGPGLAVLLTFGDQGAAALLPASSGLAPEWVKSPDPTGESKLATLAQELSMLLVPENLMADQFHAVWVDDLASVLSRGSLAPDAAFVPLELAAGEVTGRMSLVWPLASPRDALPPAEEPADEPADEAAASTNSADQAPAKHSPRIFDFSQLPPYSRSLLRVEVPVSVTLAEKKQSIDEVMALGPGSILTFNRSCEAPIDVHVGERHVALGEAVKVGEKFGVKIREIVMPPENFDTVRR